VKLLAEIVGSDPDPLRRAIYQLSLATQLGARGYTEEAVAFAEQAEPTIRLSLDREGDALRRFGRETRRLTLALATRLASTLPDADLSGSPARPAPPSGNASPRVALPLSYQAMGFLSPARTFTYFLFSLCMTMALGFWGPAIWNSLTAAQIQIEEHTRALLLPLYITTGSFLVLSVLSMLGRPLFWRVMNRRFSQVLAGFDAAVEQASSNEEKRELLLRLCRFLAKSEIHGGTQEFDLIERKPWLGDLRRLVQRHFRHEVFGEAADQSAELTSSMQTGSLRAVQHRISRGHPGHAPFSAPRSCRFGGRAVSSTRSGRSFR